MQLAIPIVKHCLILFGRNPEVLYDSAVPKEFAVCQLKAGSF